MASFAVARSPLASDGSGAVQDADRAWQSDIRLGDTFSQTNDTPGEPGPFPENMPPGFETLIFLDGSTKFFTSHGSWNLGGEWLNDNRVLVVNDSASKHGTVIEKRFFIGDVDGWNGFASLNNTSRRFRELYCRVVIKLSDNWQKHGSGEKYMLSGGSSVQSPSGGILVPCPRFNRSNYVFPDGESLTSSPFLIPIIPGSPDQSDVNADVLRQSEFSPRLQRGQYHTIEYIRRSASGTLTHDGHIRYWLDDVGFTRFSAFGGGPRSQELRDVSMMNIQATTDPTSFPEPEGPFRLILYWGGQGDTKNRDDYVRMSEFVWAGKDEV